MGTLGKSPPGRRGSHTRRSCQASRGPGHRWLREGLALGGEGRAGPCGLCHPRLAAQAASRGPPPDRGSSRKADLRSRHSFLISWTWSHPFSFRLFLITAPRPETHGEFGAVLWAWNPAPASPRSHWARTETSQEGGGPEGVYVLTYV